MRMRRGWRRGPMLGRGSSAAVSLAAASPSGEAFAVKSAELARSGALRREQSILCGLRSPYIISYLGFDVTEEDVVANANRTLHYNLFIEYAPGGSLSDEIRRHGGRLDEQAIRSRTRQILRGLAYLHEHGIAHCDVKARNVLIGSDGRAKIADLGCARRVADDGGGGGGGGPDGARRGRRRRQLRGTPMFMAPEVARGEEQGTAAADVWALGCTVVEMATGGAPWPCLSDPVAALHRIAFSSGVPEFPRWMPEEGKDFLGRCLRRDPEERWTAEQLLAHPFVAAPSEPSCTAKVGGGIDQESPKSILDQGLWASLAAEEDDEIPVPTISIRADIGSDCQANSSSNDSASERLRGLAGAELSGPDWTWGDDWVMVRRVGGREIAIEMEAEEDVRSSTSGCDEEFVFRVNHVENEEDLCRGPHGRGFVSENGFVQRDCGGMGLFSCCKRELRFCNANANLVQFR